MTLQLTKTTHIRFKTLTRRLIDQRSIARYLKQLPIIRAILFRRAVTRAFQGFAIAHPDWVASLFDDHFLSRQTAELMAQYRADSTLPDPQALALAWEAQIGLPPSHFRQHRMADLVMAADDFLQWLREALTENEMHYS